uniref:Prostaglandin E synthase 2 n=1 Tax=Setaria digitata TaxID=48799 RepID=A0A915PSH2_9BILA
MGFNYKGSNNCYNNIAIYKAKIMWNRCMMTNLKRFGNSGGILISAAALAGFTNYEENSGIIGSVKHASVGKWHTEGPLKHPVDGTLIARRIVSDYDCTDLKLRLYQYEACPFCCKVRAFLNYYGFSYDVVEVSPLTRKEIKKLDGVSKLPTVIAQMDRKLSDSSLIISILASYMSQNDRSLDDVIDFYPEQVSIAKESGKQITTHPNMYKIMTSVNSLSKMDQEKARKEEEWRKWVDEHFIPLIVPNVYRSWNECIQTFRWFGEAGQWDKVVPAWERYATIYLGSIAMYFLSKKLRKKYNDADVRQLLIDACNEWLSAIGNSSFLGGQQPTLADLALYGAINSFLGSKTFQDLCDKTQIKTWFERMREAVDSRAGAALLQKNFRKRIQP